MGDHLGQIMEKKGQPDQARRLYAMALSAEYHGAETERRLAKLTGFFAAAVMRGYAKDLLQMRTFTLAEDKLAAGTADFYVLLGGDGRPQEVKFIGGDPHLRAIAPLLRTYQMADPMPQGTPAKIIRRGTATCAPSGCSFVLALTSSAKPEQ
jgi:hypothetical protein